MRLVSKGLPAKVLYPVFALALVFSTNSTSFAASLQELQQKKVELEKRASDSSSKKETLEKELQEVENDIQTIEEKLKEISDQISQTNKEIRAKEQSIAQIQLEIKEIKEKIRETEIDLESKKEAIKQDLRMMASKGNVKLIEMLFRSEDVSEFLFRFNTYLHITKKSEELHNEVKQKLNLIKEQKELLEAKNRQLVVEKESLEAKKRTKEAQLAEQKRLQDMLYEKKAHVEEEIHEEELAMQEIAKLIQQTEKAIRFEKAKIEEAKRKAEEERKKRERERQHEGNPSDSQPQLGGGILGLPLPPGSYYISSGFGYRTHPVYGTQSFHNGIDMAAPKDTPIYAAEEGYVLFAGPANGYGNWIVIKHPNGLYTIYGHMYSDGIFVSPGEYVFRGQHIGAVGSAGTSTGNHLHFSVATSFNGYSFTYANPLNYLQH